MMDCHGDFPFAIVAMDGAIDVYELKIYPLQTRLFATTTV